MIFTAQVSKDHDEESKNLLLQWQLHSDDTTLEQPEPVKDTIAEAATSPEHSQNHHAIKDSEKSTDDSKAVPQVAAAPDLEHLSSLSNEASAKPEQDATAAASLEVGQITPQAEHTPAVPQVAAAAGDLEHPSSLSNEAPAAKPEQVEDATPAAASPEHRQNHHAIKDSEKGTDDSKAVPQVAAAPDLEHLSSLSNEASAKPEQDATAAASLEVGQITPQAEHTPAVPQVAAAAGDLEHPSSLSNEAPAAKPEQVEDATPAAASPEHRQNHHAIKDSEKGTDDSKAVPQVAAAPDLEHLSSLSNEASAKPEQDATAAASLEVGQITPQAEHTPAAPQVAAAAGDLEHPSSLSNEAPAAEPEQVEDATPAAASPEHRQNHHAIKDSEKGTDDSKAVPQVAAAPDLEHLSSLSNEASAKPEQDATAAASQEDGQITPQAEQLKKNTHGSRGVEAPAVPQVAAAADLEHTSSLSNEAPAATPEQNATAAASLEDSQIMPQAGNNIGQPEEAPHAAEAPNIDHPNSPSHDAHAKPEQVEDATPAAASPEHRQSHHAIKDSEKGTDDSKAVPQVAAAPDLEHPSSLSNEASAKPEQDATAAASQEDGQITPQAEHTPTVPQVAAAAADLEHPSSLSNEASAKPEQVEDATPAAASPEHRQSHHAIKDSEKGTDDSKAVPQVAAAPDLEHLSSLSNEAPAKPEQDATAAASLDSLTRKRKNAGQEMIEVKSESISPVKGRASQKIDRKPSKKATFNSETAEAKGFVESVVKQEVEVKSGSISPVKGPATEESQKIDRKPSKKAKFNSATAEAKGFAESVVKQEVAHESPCKKRRRLRPITEDAEGDFGILAHMYSLPYAYIDICKYSLYIYVCVIYFHFMSL